MIHIWQIDDKDRLVLNVKELLKYPMLAAIYQNDYSKEKHISHEYFKYLDYMTNSSGYCVRHGLSFKEAHTYSHRQTTLPSDFKFPPHNADVVAFVAENIEYDVVATLVKTAIKALRVSTRSLETYIDNLNEMAYDKFKDKEGNPIDISTIISKNLNTISNIPKDIANLEKLLELQKNSKQVVRGSSEYKSSMDSDVDLDKYIPDKDEDDE